MATCDQGRMTTFSLKIEMIEIIVKSKGLHFPCRDYRCQITRGIPFGEVALHMPFSLEFRLRLSKHKGTGVPCHI